MINPVKYCFKKLEKIKLSGKGIATSIGFIIWNRRVENKKWYCGSKIIYNVETKSKDVIVLTGNSNKTSIKVSV